MSIGAAGSTAPARVLVTGAAGFIGSHVVDALLAKGHEVTGLDCFTDYYARSIKEANLASALADPHFTFVEADLRTADLVEIVSAVDVVVHEAAMGGLLRSWTHFDTYVSCNVVATQRLLEACTQGAVGHFVHASTSSVYGRDASGDEDRPLEPDSPYGVTKLAAEHLIRAYHKNFGIPFTTLRYFSIYGPRQRPDMGYHIFIERILRDEEIVVFGDGSQTRGNTYVDDCVRATLAAVELGPRAMAINVGGGDEISVLSALKLIGELATKEPRIRHAAARPGEQTRALADVTRARKELGWAPSVSIRDGLARQIAWQAAVMAAA
jgi:nucleoside-diphosphate-sugar epimerase